LEDILNNYKGSYIKYVKLNIIRNIIFYNKINNFIINDITNRTYLNNNIFNTKNKILINNFYKNINILYNNSRIYNINILINNENKIGYFSKPCIIIYSKK